MLSRHNLQIEFSAVLDSLIVSCRGGVGGRGEGVVQTKGEERLGKIEEGEGRIQKF